MSDIFSKYSPWVLIKIGNLISYQYYAATEPSFEQSIKFRNMPKLKNKKIVKGKKGRYFKVNRLLQH